MASIDHPSAGVFRSEPDNSGLALIVAIFSVLCWATLAVTFSLLAIAYLINGDEGISDNWVGYSAGYALLGSLAITFLTFVLALFLRWRHSQHPLLWVSLYGFPVLVLTTLLLELFVIE
ncbi:MAG: hypothetical protein RJA15_196 [Actinomycetota bacterium]|jgi:hypothetical protein